MIEVRAVHTPDLVTVLVITADQPDMIHLIDALHHAYPDAGRYGQPAIGALADALCEATRLVQPLEYPEADDEQDGAPTTLTVSFDSNGNSYTRI